MDIKQLFEVETGMGNEQETPAPALDVHPVPGSQTTSTDASSLPLQSGPATASPHFHRLPRVPRTYLPFLAAEAARTCVRCVKLLKSRPDHRCRRTHRYRKCEYCTNIKKPWISIPRPLRSNVAHLLKYRTDADFAQQAESVGEEMKAYICHDHREAGGELAQLVHLERCINRNLLRIANSLQGTAGGEEYEEEDEEVEEGVFSGAVS